MRNKLIDVLEKLPVIILEEMVENNGDSLSSDGSLILIIDDNHVSIKITPKKPRLTLVEND